MEFNRARATTHRAGWLVIDSRTVIENGYIQVESGVIKSIGSGTPSHTGTLIDHGSGVLMPALVNVHTHLELSAFKDKIDFEHGFREWVRQLISLRDQMSSEDLLAGVRSAVRKMLFSGTGMVGEISTTGLTCNTFLQCNLKGIWFHEKLGNCEEESLERALGQHPSKGLAKCSLAGHAPHTTSPGLLARLRRVTRSRQLPFSIHVAESRDESEFLKTGKGAWAEFLMERGIDFSTWGLPVSSSVQYLSRLGVLGPTTIAVHVIRADRRDIEILRDSGTPVCLCLRSNRNLHDRHPDVTAVVQSGIRPCLGTDSLASTGSMSMFDEMAFVADCFPDLSLEQIFSMATVNGARALGFEHQSGTLTPGKTGPIIYVPVKAASGSMLMEKIVHADFKGDCSPI